MTKYEFKGRVVAIGETKEVGSNGFLKREIVVDNAPPYADYPNPVPFILKKNRTALADGLTEGDEVVVTFTIDGRKWDGPNGTKYFVDHTALGFEKLGNGSADADGGEYKPTKDGAWAAWLATHPKEGVDKFVAFLAQTRPDTQAKANAKGVKFGAVADEADWKAVIDALTGDGAGAEGDPDDLPF